MPNILTFNDDGLFTPAQINGADRIDRPFTETGDSATQVIYRPMIVHKPDYTPLALDTPHPTVTDAYLVKERGFSDDAGTTLMTYERMYAQVPADRIAVFTGTQTYTYPGFDTGGNIGGIVRTVTGVSTVVTVSSIAVSNTVLVGDVVHITALWTGTVGYAFSDYRVALTGTTSSSVKVAVIGGGDTFSEGTLTQLNFKPRGQEAKLTSSNTDYTYFLPGVTAGVSSPSDVIESPTFNPFSSDTFSQTKVLSDRTIPNFRDYKLLITGESYLLINSRITRWHGNILQKANLKVRAL